MNFYTGDLHGNFDIHKLSTQSFKEQKILTKKDNLFIAGDFGLIWYSKKSKYYSEEKYWLDWLNDRNFTTLVVLGNHENYDLINSGEYKTIPMFGDEVLKIRDSIFVLKTGHIYLIDGMKYFIFGGGMSIDKHRRIDHVSWWAEEIPSYSEMKLGLDNLAKNNNEIDVIITHATHSDMFESLSFLDLAEKEKDPLVPYLTEVKKTTKYKFWVNGHYHIDKIHQESKTITMYHQIVNHEDLIKVFYG